MMETIIRDITCCNDVSIGLKLLIEVSGRLSSKEWEKSRLRGEMLSLAKEAKNKLDMRYRCIRVKNDVTDFALLVKASVQFGKLVNVSYDNLLTSDWQNLHKEALEFRLTYKSLMSR